jgi:hypothetical protein
MVDSYKMIEGGKIDWRVGGVRFMGTVANSVGLKGTMVKRYFRTRWTGAKRGDQMLGPTTVILITAVYGWLRCSAINDDD